MIIKIDKNGNLKFIYKDSHPALKLGKPDIQRISDVRFDNKQQLWYAYILGSGDKLTGCGFKNREFAIENEINFIEKQIINNEI